MTGEDTARQVEVIRAAVENGFEWIDTAAGYGSGKSETAIGRALQALSFPKVQVATKFRLNSPVSANPYPIIRDSLLASLGRLKLPNCELLYLHNAITKSEGDIPSSLAVEDILRPDGVLQAMCQLKQEGLARNLALTATGDPECNLRVLTTGKINAIQIPYHLLNPSAGMSVPPGVVEFDYGEQIPQAKKLGVRVFAIRVLAGGALAMLKPSQHTMTTPYFPLDLFRKDTFRGGRLRSLLPKGMELQEAAIRFALSNPDIDCVLAGLGTVEEVKDLARFASLDPLDEELKGKLLEKALSKPLKEKA